MEDSKETAKNYFYNIHILPLRINTFKVYILKYLCIYKNIHMHTYRMIYNTTFAILVVVISGKQNYR